MDFFKCLKIKIKIILKNSKKSTFEFLNFFLINNQNKNENGGIQTRDLVFDIHRLLLIELTNTFFFVSFKY